MITVREDVKLTPKQAQLASAIDDGLKAGRWEWISGGHYILLRHGQVVDTPDYLRRYHDEPTMERLLFLAITTGRKWSITLTNSPAPNAQSQDSTISMTKALAVLANPRSVWGEE
ncbi:hypothetical protein [Nocardia sp. NPDC059239]|uniref:hypothetical protein n=1 Tax=unclassified Nocardia TaxID=2637762 RepID=UPI0036779864